ncbi:TPA: hypothetical protein HA246_01475 [Candidatus Woesearchaeota archaeon]|nr:hypothetical protein [Candidatus Woesearchaeota archaeon]
MIKLIHGEPGHLEGRVLVYSRYKNDGKPGTLMMLGQETNIDDGWIFGRYGVANPEGFRHIANFLGNGLEQVIKDTKKKAASVSSPPPNAITCNAQYIFPVDLIVEAVERLPKGAHDIIHAGNYRMPETCIYALDLGIKLYRQLWTEQLRPETKRKAKPDYPISHYNEINGRVELECYLSAWYITPMQDALQKGDMMAVITRAMDMLEFFEGTSFQPNIIGLLVDISQGRCHYNKELLAAHLGKIDAIEHVNFEKAAQLNNEIKRLRANS